jgi:hypothetical protein
MPIEKVERFVVNGREFKSHAAAEEYCAGRLMGFLYPVLGCWTTGEKLKLIKYLTANREQIAHLLDY